MLSGINDTGRTEYQAKTLAIFNFGDTRLDSPNRQIYTL